MLKCIVNSFAEFLRVDDRTSCLLHPLYARICIEIADSQKIPDKVWIQVEGWEGFWQVVEQESLQEQCSFCHKLGHSRDNCRKKKAVKEREGRKSRAQSTQVWQPIEKKRHKAEKHTDSQIREQGEKSQANLTSGKDQSTMPNDQRERTPAEQGQGKESLGTIAARNESAGEMEEDKEQSHEKSHLDIGKEARVIKDREAMSQTNRMQDAEAKSPKSYSWADEMSDEESKSSENVKEKEEERTIPDAKMQIMCNVGVKQTEISRCNETGGEAAVDMEIGYMVHSSSTKSKNQKKKWQRRRAAYLSNIKVMEKETRDALQINEETLKENPFYLTKETDITDTEEGEQNQKDQIQGESTRRGEVEDWIETSVMQAPPNMSKRQQKRWDKKQHSNLQKGTRLVKKSWS